MKKQKGRIMEEVKGLFIQDLVKGYVKAVLRSTFVHVQTAPAATLFLGKRYFLVGFNTALVKMYTEEKCTAAYSSHPHPLLLHPKRNMLKTIYFVWLLPGGVDFGPLKRFLISYTWADIRPFLPLPPPPEGGGGRVGCASQL